MTNVRTLGPEIVVAPPGPRSRELGDLVNELECPAFSTRRKSRTESSQLPFVIERGAGSFLFDVDGNRYVDLASGFGAASFGHGPSVVHQRAAEQALQLVQGLGDLLPTAVKVELMRRLTALHPDPHAKVLLGQSGADAVTAAIKTACLASGKSGLVAFEGSYHGLSYAPLAACGFQPSFRAPFHEQLNPNVSFAPFPTSEAGLEETLSVVERALELGNVGALLVEPVLGRGGVLVPPRAFLPRLAELTTRSGALLIVDEIWTGMGRSGALSLSLEQGVSPDLLCFGKALGASFPISACIGSERAMAAWARSGQVVHTSTHAGAPLGCAAALAVLDQLADGEVVRAVKTHSDAFRRDAAATLAPFGVEVRGVGWMVGLALPDAVSGRTVFSQLLARGYVTTLGGANGQVIVLTPQLLIEPELTAGFLEAFTSVLAEGGAQA